MVAFKNRHMKPPGQFSRSDSAGALSAVHRAGKIDFYLIKDGRNSFFSQRLEMSENRGFSDRTTRSCVGCDCVSLQRLFDGFSFANFTTFDRFSRAESLATLKSAMENFHFDLFRSEIS